VAAVLLEPIQGEAGIRIPGDGYLAALRSICDEQGWLLICDEIQSGLCRTGQWYAYQHEDIRPDILTTAKALGNGFPVSACIAGGEAAEAFTPGRHGSTFGGNPLACRTACTVLDIMENDRIADRAAKTGADMIGAFKHRLADDPRVTDIRGRGLMIGIEVDREINDLKDAALEQGLLMNVTRNNVIRLLPPLIIDSEQAEMIVDTVCGLVQSLPEK
jgi:acetylornithine aminotransferase